MRNGERSLDFGREIELLKRMNRFRERRVFSDDIIDLASNDYLNLSSSKKLLRRAMDSMKKYHYHSPRASMLVNGYSDAHAALESALCEIHGAESCCVVGSGFLGNLAIFDTLIRSDDYVLVDSEYHASGRFLSDKMTNASLFEHNNVSDLKSKFSSIEGRARRVFLAVEGVYSMSGDLLSRDVLDFGRSNGMCMVVDEAHSSGVIGRNLRGIYDYYGLTIGVNDVVLGTLSKAYASYGGYILGSESAVRFLLSKARSIIFTTALSIFDCVLALENMRYVHSNAKKLVQKLDKKRRTVRDRLNIDIDSLILRVPCSDSVECMHLQRELLRRGILVGAIRPPSTRTAQLRIILRSSNRHIRKVCDILRSLRHGGL